ncbi:MAG TPA: GrpB family protein [Actinomycetes bacterium]
MPDGPRELRLVVTATDYDAALRFYRDVLGLQQQAAFDDENGGRATLLHAGRATVELGDEAHADAIDALEVGRRVTGPLRVAFEVGDAAAMADRLAAGGASVVAPAVRTPWGSVNARLDGPAGLHLTVYSHDPYVIERPLLDGPVVLAEPDPTWATTGAALIGGIREALGPTALVVEHAGSTSVPGLPAKPVIDLVLGVPDPVDEPAYVPALESTGYQLHIREPEWHEHRLLKRTGPDVNLHVFAGGSVEIERMLAFRDHLRRDDADRERYLRAKRELAARTWAFTQDYADAKSDVVEDIMTRALAQEPDALRGCLVLVSGPPGSGKTTLAEGLADRLGLPLLAKDSVKEALLDELGAQDVEASRTLGRAAVTVLLAVARQSGGAVLEGPWRRDRAGDVAALPGRLVEVFCRVDRETAMRRYRARADRHDGHFDDVRAEDELWGDQVTAPVDGGWPVIEQDTSAPVDLDQLVRQVRQAARD